MNSKFISILIILSNANIPEEAAKEWLYIEKKQDQTRGNHCVCGRLIIHQYYYININTKKIICCGGKCKEYIDKYLVRQINNRLRDDLINCGLLSENIGEYDLNEWCKKNEEIIFNNFINKIDLLLTSDECHKYAEYLNEYWFELIDIDELLDKLDDKIEQFEMERLERERLERERLERERLERDRLERLERVRLERERLERERLEREILERLEREKLERERLERERLERLEREKLERERLEKDNKCCELYGIKSCNCGFYCVK
jgi:hypothetical protein